MSWTTSTADLRTLLSDGPTDRYRYRQKVFGDIDGTNTVFKSFDFRRVTLFTSAAAPLGVFVNNALASVASDDLATGEFTLSVAPARNSQIRATYYSQWFLDTELATFLTQALGFLGVGSDITLIDPGLQPAVLKHAAADAYQKLAIRWAEHMSEAYRLEDKPQDKLKEVVDSYFNMAKQYRTEAFKLRDDFYLNRKGQALAPRFQSISGVVRDPVPRS